MERYSTLLISPLLFICLYFYLKYKYPKGEFRLLFMALLYGFIIALPLIALDQAAHYFRIDGARSLRRMIMYSFIFIGFAHEFFKFLPLHYDITRRKIFGGAADGIVYAMAIALGLTTLFAIYYSFFGNHTEGDWLYLITIGPMNALFAVILGFFTGMGKMRKNRFIDSMTGLGAATFFHGVYRFTLLSNDVLFFAAFAAGTLLIATILIHRSRYIKPDSK